MPGTADEWRFQSKYDLETARAMLKAHRYIYVVFMCHLALEKMLKGLYVSVAKEQPPKTHNLVHLVKLCNPSLTEELNDFISVINNLSVSTRYPDDLSKAIEEFNHGLAEYCIRMTEKVIKCLWKDPKSNK